MRVFVIASRLFAAAVLIGAAIPTPALADPPASVGPVEVSAAVGHDVSAPLRVLGPSSPAAATLRERPLRLTGPGSSPSQADGALQAAAGTALATTGGLGFAGVGQGDYGFSDRYAPPDTNGVVGDTQYVQWVNVSLAVFDKATGQIAAGFPKAGNAVWAGFGGGCETNNDGDPIVQYDKAAHRWILTQFSVSTTPYLQCVAVSTGPDATGTYNRYAFSYGATQFPDYPKLSVWPDAYYISFNMFTSTFVGAKVCAYDRAAMLAGAAASQQCFQLGSSYGGLLASDLDGVTPPPAGSPNFVLNFGANSLNLWRFHVDWANSANTSLSGPVSIPVASFSRACNGSNCVPQPGTSQKLDSLGDRLMYRLAYRRFADGHEALVVNHSVSVGGSLFSSGVSSVRWYELRNATGSTIAAATPLVYQQGTLGTADGTHRWMGSIAMDQAGDIALGYSASSGTVYPSIRYTGRVPTDPLNTMATENSLKAGSGSQLQNLSRWGDYSAMTVDPIDDCTFWYTNEYLKANGTFNWSTWISSFRFPGCGAAASVPGAPSLNSPTTGNATVGLTWSAAAANGSTVTNYKVYRGTSSNGEVLLTTLGNVTSFNDSSLTNGQIYYYKVSAVNGVGEGPQSNERSATPVAASVPGAPSLNSPTTGNATVGLTWSAAAANGSTVTNYKVYRGTSSNGEVLLTTLGNVTSFNDSSLTNGQIYYYKVSAVNGVGEGPQSNERSATPVAASVPGAPSLNSPTTGNATVGLTWSAAAANGSTVTNYKVYRGTSSNGEVLLTTLGNVTSFNDSSLTNGQIYYYKVSAVNGVGEGPQSNERSATPVAASVPGAPSLAAASIGFLQPGIKLTWTVPANNGSAITGYRVYRGTSSGTETFLTTLSPGLTTWNDTSTSGYVRSYYRISAVNGSGEGPASNEASAFSY